MQMRTKPAAKLSSAAILLGILWITYQLALPPSPAAAGNILANPGFESAKGTQPNEWKMDQRGQKRGRATLTTRNVKSGHFALQLEPAKGNSNDILALNMAQGFSISPLKGKSLQLSAWLAADGGATALFGVWAIDAKGGIIASERVMSTGGEYTHQTATFDVPTDGAALLLIVECQVLGQSGNAYFDDVSIETTESSAANTASQLNANSGARVMVDATRVIRQIPRTLYGHNIQWSWGGNMIFDFRTNQLSPELIRLTKDLNLSLLRFPGGSFADFYHWRDGVGPQAARKETQHQPGDAKSKHTFGTDEALTFAESTGTHLLITVNAHTGTPAEAADWIRYTNQQAPSRHVRYWEIGNEFYIKNDSPANAAIPPVEYARRVTEFARAMREADPTVKLIGIGAENFGRYHSSAFPNWNREVLNRAGHDIDYIALHNAYFPAVLTETSLKDVRRVYAAMLAAPKLIAGNLETVSRQIREYAPGRNIKIAITEWSPLFQLDSKSPWIDHVKTLGSALYVASTMNTFLGNPDVEIANAFKLNDIGYMGWIGARYKDHLTRAPADNQYVPTALYLAMQMYTRDFGAQLVTTSTESPSYDSSAIGMVDAVRGVPYLEAVSSLSEDDQSLYIIVVNKHFDNAIRTELSLKGFRPHGKASIKILNGTGIDANTGTQLPQGVAWSKQNEDSKNPRFHLGGPNEVKITTQTIEVDPNSFTFEFPAHSITAIRMDGQRLRP